MQIQPYVNFKGDCEAAFAFYAEHLGAEIGALFRYGGSPFENRVPPEWSHKVMHGNLTISGQALAGADVTPEQYEAPKGFSLSLQVTSVADADRMFEALATDGTVIVPLEKTFWSERFGMVVDRFGIPWMINCESSAEPADV
jgi:PhnB protein